MVATRGKKRAVEHTSEDVDDFGYIYRCFCRKEFVKQSKKEVLLQKTYNFMIMLISVIDLNDMFS